MPILATKEKENTVKHTLVKKGAYVTGFVKKLFLKKYVVKTEIVYTDTTGSKAMGKVTNYVEAYNKEQAAKLARESIFGHMSFNSEATIAK